MGNVIWSWVKSSWQQALLDCAVVSQGRWWKFYHVGAKKCTVEASLALTEIWTGLSYLFIGFVTWFAGSLVSLVKVLYPWHSKASLRLTPFGTARSNIIFLSSEITSVSTKRQFLPATGTGEDNCRICLKKRLMFLQVSKDEKSECRRLFHPLNHTKTISMSFDVIFR